MTEVEQTTDSRGVSVTLKAGTEYSAPWVVVRAGTVDEVGVILSDEEKVKNLLNIAAQAGVAFQGVYRTARGVGGEVTQVTNEPAQQSSPQAAPAGGPPAPQCKHGEMEWKDFTSKAGNAVKGHFCQSRNRDDQCPPQWKK